MTSSSTPSPQFSSASPSTAADSITFLSLPITTKLTPSNYLSWQSQVLPILHGYDLYKFVHLTRAAPSPTIINSSGQVEFNPAYLSWHKQDQILLDWLRASLSEKVLAQVVSASTSSQLWDALQRSYSSTSRARLTELRRSLHTTNKGSSSCYNYIDHIRALTDELSFIGHPVSDVDLVSFVLNGLGAEFNSFVASINTRVEPIHSYDLYSLLLKHEQLLQTQYTSSVASVNTSPATFYSHNQTKGRFNKNNN